jgi:hypothetical protein
VRDSWEDAELARRFRASAEESRTRAPLNTALATIIAGDRDLYGLLTHAPEPLRLPTLLYAAVHSLVLDDPDSGLARWYPNLHTDARSPDDPALAPTLKDFVAQRRAAVVSLVERRRVQTNEVGRCALYLPPLAMVGDEVGELAHLDIGASAGLNLLIDRYEYLYDDGPAIGGPSTVRLDCGTRGDGPVPSAIPNIAARCGIDLTPVDITDKDEARWIEACCWPDQADRFDRLRAAIEIAGDHPPELLAGDAVESVAPAVERMAVRGHPVVTTSWVLNQLDPERRQAFVSELDRVGQRIDVSWIFAESPALTSGLPHATEWESEHLTALSLVRWRDGQRNVDHLATCHPHGYWLHWR